MNWNFGNYKDEWKVRQGWQQRKLATNGKSKNAGSGPPIGGFQVTSRRWRRRTESEAKGETATKRHIRRVKTENQETERKNAKDGTMERWTIQKFQNFRK